MSRMYCKDCGNIGPSKRVLRGSGLFETILWAPALLAFFSVLYDLVMQETAVGEPTAADFARQGSRLIWVMIFSIPGLVYSIWRFTTIRRGCQHCESSAIIPLDSPMARAARDAAQLSASHSV